MAIEIANGNDSVINIGDASNLQNLSPLFISAWIYPTGWGENNYARILCKETTTPEGWVFFLSNYGGVNGIETLCFLRWRATTDCNIRGADYSISLNQWQHVAVGYNGSAVDLYVNGVNISTIVDEPGAGAESSDIGQDLLLGNRAGLDRDFDGYMEDLRVYNRKYEIEKVEHLYHLRGRDNIVEQLEGWWPLKEKAPGETAGPDTPYKSQDSSIVATGSSVTLSRAAAATGDLLLAIIAVSGDDTGTPGNITTPSGWTLVNSVDAPSDSSTPSLFVFRRTKGALDPITQQFDCDQTCTLIGVMLHYDGNEIGSSEDAEGTNTGTSDTGISPSITPSDNAIVLRIVVGDVWPMPIPPENIHPDDSIGRYQDEEYGGTYGDGCGIGIAEQILPSGATGTASHELYESTEWCAMSLAFLGGDGGGVGPTVKDLSVNRNDGTANNSLMTYKEGTTLKRRNP